ncbi:hypothetical protein [Phenylobacterium sp.]|jgi:hypothetical protein|uniref:hypothetical protein n=1 Tax=Phenylobacterium sp. TaxID=1871053 RepID=UPI002F95CDC8
MVMTVPTIARTDRRWFRDLPDRLQEAVEAYDYQSKPEWSDLADLSEVTELQSIVTHGQSAVIEDGHWIAPATVYVRLLYEPGTKEQLELSEAFPARIEFEVRDDESIAITSIRADVSSFYDDEPSEEETP